MHSEETNCFVILRLKIDKKFYADNLLRKLQLWKCLCLKFECKRI